MDFAHIYALHNLLDSRRYPVQLDDILQRLECSKSTFYRIRDVMIDYLGAPIVNRRGKGYCYDLNPDETFELPGLWFTVDEIIALSLLTQISESIQPALVSELLKPLEQRFHKCLARQNIKPQHWYKRIKVTSQWQRPCHPDLFKCITSALLHRQQLQITHWHWHQDQYKSRIISPQRLVLYRDNWYLDAWCHLRRQLRTFAVDAINQALVLQKPTREIPQHQLDAHFTDGYGIFAGQKQAEATLKFSPLVSRRIKREKWHPQQISQWTDDNELLLIIPYSDPRELLRDILHYGSDVEVLAPETLRNQVTTEIEKTLRKYR